MHRTSIAAVVWLVGLSAAQAASIKGTIKPGGRVTKVEALRRGRATMASLRIERLPGRFNAADGTFVIDGLTDGTYDLAIALADAVIEGVDLSVPGDDTQAAYTVNAPTGRMVTSRFDVMRYFDPDAVVSEEEKLRKARSKLRVAKLEAKVASVLKVSRFMNNNRPLWLHGTRDEARALMELVRDRQFHSGSAEEIIWRVEIWPFRWAAGGWDKPSKGVVVIGRVRTTHGKFEKMTRLFDPALGGLTIRNNQDLNGFHYDLPDRLDASMGIVAR